MSLSTADYKTRKEAFVSNLSGSSVTDINLVTLVAASAILLWTALQKRGSFFTPYTILPFGIDFLLNICAILFAFTAYSSAPILLVILLATPAVFLLLPLQPPKVNPNGSTTRKSKGKAALASASKQLDQPKLPARPFLTNYRGAMMVATMISILAVDFKVFPRRFAKVETWGTSLMDLGVGSFVFSAGIVSARAILQPTSPDISRTHPASFMPRLIKSLRHSIPLLVLGVIRLISVKNLEYAEHVTEYGVHWNFFFTLAFLQPAVELLDLFTETMGRSSDLLAIQIAVMYEITLDNTDLLSYILTAPRGPDLLSMNREGVFSFIGYLSIYLCGRRTGKTVCQFNIEPNSVKKSTTDEELQTIISDERIITLKSLALHTTTYAVLYFATTNYTLFNLTVSRRLANLPYVMWIAAFNNAQLLLFGAIEHIGPSFTYSPTAARGHLTASSRIMQSFNKNGLVVFLVANLLTGLVNLTLNTLDMDNASSMAVLLVYTTAVVAVAVGLDWSGLRLKL